MMRHTFPLALAAIALVSLAGCDKKDASGSAASSTPSGPVAAVAPPAGQDWTETVTETPDGGFLMGNPNATVKLIEYGSLTCPHCAVFSKEGAPVIKEKYVKTGKISYEFRNFVRDPVDYAAAILSRCGGAGPYFKLTEQIFADQQNWYQNLEGLTDADYKRINALPPTAQLDALAKASKLDQYVQQRGISPEKASACLADKAMQDKLVKMRQVATDQFNLQGTPTFVLNGSVLPDTAEWSQLEPKLRAAVGG